MQGITTARERCAPATVFERLAATAYEALGIEDPLIDYAAWMIACEQAWISVAGQR